MSEKRGVDFLQGGDSSYSSLSSFRIDGHQDRPSFSLLSLLSEEMITKVFTLSLFCQKR